MSARSRTKPITQLQLDGWFALVFASSTLTARIDAVLLEQHRITFSAFEIFCRLRVTEPQPVRALGTGLVSVSPTRASRIIQEHIDAGHLQRGSHQGDGRVSLVSFTDAGREYAQAVDDTFQDVLRTQFVDVLSDEDVAALRRIWRKLQKAAD